MMRTEYLISLIAISIVAAIAVWVFLQKRRSTHLRGRFGSEYDRAVHEHGDRSKAERALEQRAERTEKYHIRPLNPEEQHRFSEDWRKAQARFVDDPLLAIGEADHLVCDVMRTRGYPMSDFDHRAEDLSVDHPHVVRNYRNAHRIASHAEDGRASTEDLRQAMVYYRELFDELLETHPAGMPERRS